MWGAYKSVHAKVRTADGTQVTGTGPSQWPSAQDETNNSVDTFGAFDNSSNQLLTKTSTAVQSELKDARDGLPPIGWLGVPIGILAALLVAWGMSQRLEEYR